MYLGCNPFVPQIEYNALLRNKHKTKKKKVFCKEDMPLTLHLLIIIPSSSVNGKCDLFETSLKLLQGGTGHTDFNERRRDMMLFTGF